jgi:hypothetical protein
MKIEKVVQSRLARTDQQLRQLISGNEHWFVKSIEDVWQLREARDTPFAKLPEPDFFAFVASLHFKNGGVAGGCYKPLMNTLRLPEIFDVFAHFGMSMELFISEENDSCQECKCGGAGCSFSFWDFCSSLCNKTQ